MTIPSGIHPQSGLAHRTYILSLLFKGGIGAAQLAAGLGLALVPTARIKAFANWLARLQLVEDPTDPAALWLAHAMANLPQTVFNFYTIYLMLHGILNLALVAALVARLHWAYPAAILALIGFVIYQTYDFLTGQSAVMLVLSAIDIVVILLIWREWTAQTLRHHPTPEPTP